MAKDRFRRRDLIREQLVFQIARLMAKDGITDYALAKRKAARQLGNEESRHMPSNQEIDEALLSYRTLYQHEDHLMNLRRLREEALAIMRMLEPFHPYLTGSVLNGTSGENSDINIVLFSDDAKSVMLLMLRQQIPYVGGESKIQMRGKEISVPIYTLTSESGTSINIIVMPENSRFSGMRHSETHADIDAVETMLAG